MATQCSVKLENTMATEFSVKLLVDKKAKRVLFAEAGKDVVDFIFTFLALPVSTVIRLVSPDPFPGCISTLYESLEKLNETYIEGESKKFLLSPKIASVPRYNDQTLLLENGTNLSKPQTVYVCNSNGYHCNRQSFSDLSGTKCGYCSSSMTRALAYAGAMERVVEKGFVKGIVTYMIMDDLDVSPMSTISSIALLNKLKVEDLSVLEEKHVKLGIKEGLAILRSSFESKTVLTDVLLRH